MVGKSKISRTNLSSHPDLPTSALIQKINRHIRNNLSRLKDFLERYFQETYWLNQYPGIYPPRQYVRWDKVQSMSRVNYQSPALLNISANQLIVELDIEPFFNIIHGKPDNIGNFFKKLPYNWSR